MLHARSFCLLSFALPSLAALALPPAVHAASAVHGRRVRAAVDCAAALRIALPDAHITAASAVPSNDSLRALGEKVVLSRRGHRRHGNAHRRTAPGRGPSRGVLVGRVSGVRSRARDDERGLRCWFAGLGQTG
ncbi:MAG: hypothetical protein DMD72_03855 [Gemmatimonadetes bacterium]|nr:MAG: hypothetical protein DMD72_03855 [Gemmatimonadota bacterium]